MEHPRENGPGRGSEASPSAAGFAAIVVSIADWIALWSGRLAAISLVLIFLLVNTEIFARNVLGRSTLISDEMSGYLYVAVVLLGLPYTMQQRSFIRVEALHSHLHGSAKRAADWFCVLMSLLYLCVLFYCVTKYMIYSYVHHIGSEEITETPLFIPQSFVVLGVGFLIIYFLKFLVERCRDVP